MINCNETKLIYKYEYMPFVCKLWLMFQNLFLYETSYMAGFLCTKVKLNEPQVLLKISFIVMVHNLPGADLHQVQK